MMIKMQKDTTFVIWSKFDRSYPKWDDRSSKLLACAAFIETIPEKNFNMHHWWLPDGVAFDDYRNKSYSVSCETVGCAIGHMTQSGVFGLSPDDLKAGDRDRIFVMIGDVFGIGIGLAKFLFDQYSYSFRRSVKPRDVAARIRYIADEIVDS